MRAATLARSAATTPDLVSQRVVNELRVFGRWLAANNARGLISEIGWPGNQDPQQWNRVVHAWYQTANELKLPVLAFTAQGPGTNFAQLTMYARSAGSVSGGQSIDKAGSQAAIAEAHLGTPNYWRGIDVFGGAANDGGGDGNPAIMSNTSTGTWWYEPQGTYNYLASRGYTVARIGFRWERLQPNRGAALDATELARITDAVTKAGNAGMKAVLDLHNYALYVTAGGTHKLGSSSLPISDLVDFWTRVSAVFKDNTNVLAYSLMNEPHDMPISALGEPGARHWEAASQSCVNAIRAAGDTHEIHVSLYEWGRVYAAPHNHPVGWIYDPANNFRYEAHHYLYLDHSTAANYPHNFDTELGNCRSRWTRAMTGNTPWSRLSNLTWNQLEHL